MRSARRVLLGWLAFVVVTGGWLASVGPAAAQTGTESAAPGRTGGAKGQTTIATFEGQSIDLSTNWNGAKACIVLLRADVVECFRSLAGAEARVSAVTTLAAGYGYTCSSPLRLFEHNTYGGRQLMFFDRLYWQNLTDYGFNDQMTSYQIGACYSYLAEHVNGAGAFYPGPTSPWSVVPWPAAGWDNRVSSIYIA